MITARQASHASMCRHIAFCLFIVVSIHPLVYSQSDSLTIINTNWQTTQVAPGVKLKHYWFNHSLFGANQNINILEVRMNHRNKIDVEAEPKLLKTTSEFGIEHDALAALNGTFFNMKDGGSEDYIRLDNKTLNETTLPKSNRRAVHQRSAIVVHKGKLAIKTWNGAENWEGKLHGEDVMVTGPLLIEHGQRMALDTTSFIKARHPRSAIAVKGKMLLLITIDGRNERAAGMSLYELASFIKWLHATNGINLDGGGSTTLWVKNFPDSGVINHPSDNKAMMKSPAFKAGTDLDNLAADDKKWDHSGQRPVANVILVNKKK